MDKQFNDNTYHVVNFVRERNLVQFRVDNFAELKFTLKGEDGIFKSQSSVHVGAVQSEIRGDFSDCYYGIMSGMFFNDHYVLDRGEKQGDVGIVDYKYIHIEIDINQNRTRPLLPNGNCNLGYAKNVNVCVFEICPLNSDQVSDYCNCYEGYYEVDYACVRRNDTVIPPAQIGESSAKLIPARTGNMETPIGLILGMLRVDKSQTFIIFTNKYKLEKTNLVIVKCFYCEFKNKVKYSTPYFQGNIIGFFKFFLKVDFFYFAKSYQ